MTTEPIKSTRRTVLAGAGAVAGLGAVGYMWQDGFGNPYVQPTEHGTGDASDAYGPEDVIHSMCMMCNTFCSIKVRLTDPGDSGATSLIRKIAGNPYSPLTTQPVGPIPYDSTLADAITGTGQMATEARSRSGGMICLKGQSGIQVAHDAKRITQPLRRVGERGSGKWQTITWEQALKEVLDGSPDLGTPGMREWWAYAPQKPVMADWALVKDGTMSAAEFESKWGDKLLDPKRPELGPRSNRFALLGGDRGNLIASRFVLKVLGSVNQFNHAGICGITGVVGNARTHPKNGFQRMYADLDYCRYLIVWGTEPLTANKGPTWTAPRIGRARELGMKMVVIDPRMSKTGEKADLWLPVKPGHDAALAWAMVRWIIENKRYDETYLRQPNMAAAKAVGEPNWSDATYLVKVDDPKGAYLSTVDLGLAEPPQPNAAGVTPDPEPACMVGGQPVGTATASGPADLDVDTEIDVNGTPTRVKSVFRLLTERAMEREIDDYAEECGIDAEQIIEVARQFTSHGKRACITSYRGPAMHGNGFDTIRVINYLNFLIGNNDWKGGHITGQKGYSPTAGRYELGNVPNANTAWGIPVTREKTRYESTSFFAEDGYPAKRRWWQFPGNLCHEVIPSAVAAYPYSLYALFIHRHNPLTSSPGAHRQAEMLKDTDKIKLLVSFDVSMGDTSQLADYVLPDPTYLERFNFEPPYPTQQYAVTPLGQPTTKAFDGPRPVEQFYLELANELGLPGVGKDAFGPGADFNTVEDFWLKMAANVAYADDPIPDADAEEQRIFSEARRKALGDSYDETVWRAAVTAEEWPKVVYVLNRGGRFEGHGGKEHENAYEGEWLKYRYAGLCAFYDPKVAAAKDPMTGQNFAGLAKISAELRADQTPVPNEGLPLYMTNWKSRFQGTYRTANAAWLREIRSNNYLTISTKDATERGIATGDKVLIKSATTEAEGIALVTETIRPGVVGADSTFGHHGYFARPVEIDGEVIEAVEGYGHGAAAQAVTPLHEETGFAGGRDVGFSVNSLLPDDTVMGGGGLCDPVGGGAVQLHNWVEVTKI